jgi:extracellular elastinolytic metalloproteinase
VQRGGTEIGSIDTLGSPEAGVVTINPAATANDVFTAQICPFGTTDTAPFDVAGNYLSTDQSVSGAPGLPGPLTDGTDSGPAIWHVFGSNPQLDAVNPGAAPDDRYPACSGKAGDPNLLSKDLTGCDFLYNDGSPLPYDADPVLGAPTFTTVGNNAITTDARASSSLTPGGPLVPPVSATREYVPAWTDVWHTSDCDPQPVRRSQPHARLRLPARSDRGPRRAADVELRQGWRRARP